MKAAFQTILWGPSLERWVEVLKTIHEIGYDGVEIAQPPDRLPPPRQLQQVLNELKLEFVGFAGGQLTRRMEYCAEYRPGYLYIEDWLQGACERALEEGFTLALHPHMYKRVHRLETAAALLEQHPELKFLPDTAHLFLARDDPAEAIRRYVDRLAAVHLKDWTPRYGRSFHRYARGFVELGNGSIGLELERILEVLREVRFDGWVVVEQDCTPSDPRKSAEASAEWLANRGVRVMRRPRRDDLREGSPDSRTRPTCAPEKFVDLLDSLVHVRHRDVGSFCEKAAEAISRVIPSKVIKVWEYSPIEGLLGLVGMWPTSPAPRPPFAVGCSEVLSGLTVEGQVIRRFDLDKEYEGHRFADPNLIAQFGVTEMISVPVLNTYNPNHVELIVNIFPDRSAPIEISDQTLAKCAEYVAVMYETVIEDVSQSMAAAVNLAVAGAKRSEEFLRLVIRLVQGVLNCEGVTIFLSDQVGSKLRDNVSTGLEWREDLAIADQEYARGEGLIGRVWDRQERMITSCAPDEVVYVEKSFETVKASRHVLLIAPLTNQHGETVGVIRCRSKRPDRAPLGLNMFSESDVSIVDAICQALLPHLAVLQANERRARTLGRLTHELKVPLTAIRGAAEFIKKEAKEEGYRFSYPYAADICMWHDLTRRLLHGVDFFRYHVDGLELNLSPTYLLAGVLGPARNQIRPLLRERNFSIKGITFKGFDHIPRLWVDRNQFQQVFFNLIQNAVKYGYKDPRAFQVEVEALEEPGQYEIYFRDWGKGIPDGWEEAIFREGVRGPNAEQAHVAGDGLGLWVVRQILDLHGGTITVSKHLRPTEFRLELPKKLLRRWRPNSGV
jgi:signal transduction histidine kinase/sugar phosphate isomerase/epimerase